MTIHQKIELQQLSSGADAANTRSKALAAADAEIEKRYALRDSAVAAVLDAAAAEYAADGRGWVLRSRFHAYCLRMPGLDPLARYVALHVLLAAKVGAGGALELSFTMAGLGAELGLSRDTVRDSVVGPGGLESCGLVEVLERARGRGQSWRVLLVIGASDSDLPARAVGSFVARVRKRSGLVGT